jgi:hypothetical protein
MSGSPEEMFGRAASRLSGLAARLLGWRPPEFWAATPAELAAALASADPDAPVVSPLGRDEFNRLMEQDHD